LFLAAFGLYVATAAPSVTFWDSGELIASAFSLGISHQPGYPFYAIAGKAFSLIPFGNVAFRLNLLSAFPAALSVYFVYASVRLILERDGESLPARLTALAAGCLYGATRILWVQAVAAEVYGLNAFFVTLLIYLHIRSAQGGMPARRYIALSAFIFGLGTVNHITLGLLLPGLLISWYTAARGTVGIYRAVSSAAAFFVLGMSVLVYLPIRSLTRPMPNIGHPETLTNFIWTVRWPEYFRQLLSLPGAASRFFHTAAPDMTILLTAAVCLLAVIVLVWWLVRSDLRLYLPLILIALVHTSVTAAVALSNSRDVGFGLHEKFFIPATTFAVILGMAAVRKAFRRDGVPIWLVAALCFGGTVFLLRANLPYGNYSRHYIAHDYAMNSLKSAGERGVLLTWGDNGVFPLWYMQIVEGYRNDVVLVHTPLMTYDWYLEDVNRMMGVDIKYLEPYFLGENVYRIKKADPTRPFCYDYSSVRYLRLDERTLTPRGIVYFEGYVPPGNPWPYYVFRGVRERDFPIGKLEDNILQIYGYMARLTGGPRFLYDRSESGR